MKRTFDFWLQSRAERSYVRIYSILALSFKYCTQCANCIQSPQFDIQMNYLNNACPECITVYDSNVCLAIRRTQILPPRQIL